VAALKAAIDRDGEIEHRGVAGRIWRRAFCGAAVRASAHYLCRLSLTPAFFAFMTLAFLFWNRANLCWRITGRCTSPASRNAVTRIGLYTGITTFVLASAGCTHLLRAAFTARLLRHHPSWWFDTVSAGDGGAA